MIRSGAVPLPLADGSLLGLGPGAGGLAFGGTPPGGGGCGVPLRVGGLQLREPPGPPRRQIVSFARVDRQVKEPRAVTVAGVGELPVAGPHGALAAEPPEERFVGIAGRLT